MRLGKYNMPLDTFDDYPIFFTDLIVFILPHNPNSKTYFYYKNETNQCICRDEESFYGMLKLISQRVKEHKAY